MTGFLVIDPDERLDFTVDWADWLAQGDTIQASTWTVTPSGTVALDGESVSAAAATVFMSAARFGDLYRLTNRIVTAQNRTGERSLAIRCEQR